MTVAIPQAVQGTNQRVPYVYGFMPTYISGTQFTFSNGITSDSTGYIDIISNDTLTLDSTLIGANGLDIGTITINTVYPVYVIYDLVDGNPTALLMSLSYVQPYLPAGYQYFKRIGWVTTNGSGNFYITFVTGNADTKIYQYDIIQGVLSGGTSSTYAHIDLSKYVPKVATKVDFQFDLAGATPSNSAQVRVGGSSFVGTQLVIQSSVATTGVDSYAQFSMNCGLVAGVPTIDYIVNADGTFNVFVYGYYDFL